jgi:hypothetical protein
MSKTQRNSHCLLIVMTCQNPRAIMAPERSNAPLSARTLFRLSAARCRSGVPVATSRGGLTAVVRSHARMLAQAPTRRLFSVSQHTSSQTFVTRLLSPDIIPGSFVQGRYARIQRLLLDIVHSRNATTSPPCANRDDSEDSQLHNSATLCSMSIKRGPDHMFSRTSNCAFHELWGG